MGALLLLMLAFLMLIVPLQHNTISISLSWFFHKNQNCKMSMAYQNPWLKSCIVACYLSIFA
jgi:hypothetical protein